METQKMTIHRALSELKLIDARIEKAINVVEPTGLMRENKPVPLMLTYTTSAFALKA